MVYVNYLEAAPWNVASFIPPGKFRGVGSILIGAAINLSLDEGFYGRIGLHSLPQAERFYAKTCGMEELGIDPQVEDLRYFEMTQEQAAAFVG